MRKIILLLILLVGLPSCKSSKRVKNKNGIVTKVVIDRRPDYNGQHTSPEHTKKASIEFDSENTPIVFNIINYAKQFKGVKYKWGGTTNKGMDCSGLVFESFKAYDIYLPRISRDMAKQGEKISLRKTQKGDLLFFKTRNRRNTINHVGLVVEIEDNTIKFIHATTTNGVIISSLNETYWINAFSEVRRIL